MYADVYGLGIEIDSAVKLVLLGVESHRSSYPLRSSLSGEKPFTFHFISFPQGRNGDAEAPEFQCPKKRPGLF